MTPPSADLSREAARAVESYAAALGPVGSVAVAFSGGVDSTVATALAVRHLGADAVVAVLGVSPSLAADERAGASRTAAHLGVRLLEVATYELDDPRYVANAGDRCYFCKHELYTRAFAEALTSTGSEVLVNGDHADDLAAGGDRPGRRAASELGVRSPLADAGVGKDVVRLLARELALPVWDKPSSPCLASRFPTRVPVTIGGLAMVDRAETTLRGLGLRDLRVRHRGRRARVELSGPDHARLRSHDLRRDVLAGVRAAGYDEVEIDPAPLVRS